MLENRSKLGEAQSLQQFSRDVDEMEIWITERLHTALDESYRDPANIQVIGLTQGSVSRSIKLHNFGQFLYKLESD